MNHTSRVCSTGEVNKASLVFVNWFHKDGKITISNEAYAKVKDSGYFFVEKVVFVSNYNLIF